MASSRSSTPSDSPKRVSCEPTPSPPHVTTNPDILALLETSDEDDTILRPRGKLAARMLQKARVDESESEMENDTTDALRQSETSETRKSATENDQDTQEEEEDEIVTTRPRKLQSRRQRSTTPETRPQEAASASPGLIVSPSKPHSPTAGSEARNGSGSDNDLPTVAGLAKKSKKSRLLALEAEKRSAREAKEAKEARRKAERLATQQSFEEDISGDEDSNVTDDDGGRKLTQRASRPAARKASKKALEEMNRETQRLTRSLQLAHEVKVKKKITKATLFERFNFKVPGSTTSTTPAVPDVPASSSRPASPVSHPTDVEDKDTPPSSPPVSSKDAEAEKGVHVSPSEIPAVEDDLLEEDENGELTSLEAIAETAAAKRRLNKGKMEETAVHPEVEEVQPLPKAKRDIRVKLPPTQVIRVNLTLDDDDDDLDIQPQRKSKVDAIFDRIPVNQARESRPMQMLRRLAHLDDPERKGTAPLTKRSNKQNQQPAMTVGELEMSLLQRARMQAKLERDRHLELLRSKGIHVQTAEEREKELAQVEDIVARARKEAEELMERERQAGKADRKAKRDAGEADPLGFDDSDESSDDDYQVAPAQEEAEADVELSGSEDEDVDMDAEDADEEEAKDVDPAGILFDDLAESADESDGEEAEKEDGDKDSDDEPTTSRQPRRQPKKQTIILSDDEEEEEVAPQHIEATPRPKAKYPKSPSVFNNNSPKVPTSVLRSATKTFIPGLPVAGPAGLGLTQIFAGTMDDSQVGGSAMCSPSQPMPTFNPASAFGKIFNSNAGKSQPDAIENFGGQEFPDSNFSQTAQEIEDDMILDSQPTGKETQDPETQGVQLRFSQSQMHGFDSFLEESKYSTQISEIIEPTQDGGFRNFSPLKTRFVEPEPPISTVETVKLDGTQAESPLVRRTGKLRRKADVAAAASARASPSPASDHDEDGMDGVETDEFGFGTVTTGATAFALMKEAAAKEKKAKAQEAFDKKKSKARAMVDEQAEESEDEYAGLGGVDGEGESDDDDQSVKEMIDDETKNNEVDERKLAAFYADRERAADTKQVDKLFHDITSGMLRRKRNGDWDDLEDEDDGGEARRRMKRRQFAKMQRALFSDERISKVAENPRNQAFLRTIEDHGSDDDMDFIFAPPPVPPGLESQDSQTTTTTEEKQQQQDSATTTIPDSQPHEQRPPAHARRTKEGKKPSNIGEIRESLSNLLEHPFNSSSVIPATELGDSSDEDMDEPPTVPATNEKEKENRNPRRANHAVVVDRISLKRNSSSSSTSSSNTDRLAFAAGGGSSSSAGFRVPALLRRATTNSLKNISGVGATTTGGGSISAAATNESSSGGSNNGSGSVFGEDAKIKKSTTTSKKSGVNYFARENERRAALAENERRREAKKWKGAEGRSKVVGGLFGGGKFE